jgi:hypothetical protein
MVFGDSMHNNSFSFELLTSIAGLESVHFADFFPARLARATSACDAAAQVFHATGLWSAGPGDGRDVIRHAALMRLLQA